MENGNKISEWKNSLLKINENLVFKEDIFDENTSEETYYFFINPNIKFSFYVFSDPYGKGIGIHKRKENSYMWYFNDLDITDDKLTLQFMLMIMKDVVNGKKIFKIINDNHDIEIDFSVYPLLKYKLDQSKNISISIQELNNGKFG